VISVRAYTERDLESVVALFGRSVHALAARDYSPLQLQAWAPVAPDLGAWAERLARGQVLVAERDGEISGFASLVANCDVDLLFVDPACERQGVARALMAEILLRARREGAVRLRADVSLTARRFFERQGFVVLARQTVERRGQGFINLRMHKELAGDRQAGRPAEEREA
jgi:putative acetyltransferase